MRLKHRMNQLEKKARHVGKTRKVFVTINGKPIGEIPKNKNPGTVFVNLNLEGKDED